MVRTRKYGPGGASRLHYEFPVRAVSLKPDLWIVRGDWGRPLIHHTRGATYHIENHSLEFYWPGRPYTVSADCSRDGIVRRYYCNVNLPPAMGEGEVEWVDLDLDLLVNSDLTWRVLDEDEFEAHSREFGYPPEIVALARQALQDLIALVEGRAFPFDGSADQLARELFGSGERHAW